MKDQFVIAYLADMSMTDTVVAHSVLLSRMLGKGIILLYVEDSRYGNATVAATKEKIAAIEAAHSGADITHVALKGDTREIVEKLPTLLNGVVAVAGVDTGAKRNSPTHPREVLRIFSQSKIAYLTAQAPPAGNNAYRDVAFSIDFNKESKEKLIWASYFARFGHSRLTMLHYQYTDSGLRAKWTNNVRFMDKFFKGLGVEYNQRALEGKAAFPETIACRAAAEAGCGVFVSVTTDSRNIDVFEWFAGVQEQRTIRNTDKMPVMYINPRNDIYVLCD